MAIVERPVTEVMQEEVVTLEEGDRLDFAEDVMSLGRVRHMPVLDGARIVGMVSNRDLLAASLSKALDFEPKQRRTFMKSVDVSEVMTRDVRTVGPEATVGDAVALMLRHQIGCVPIAKPDGTLVGLVTETDVLRALVGERRVGE